MNTVGKILVVFVTACSLGFLAFVAALRSGGPNWAGEMRAEELKKEIVFTTEQGETVKYSAKYRRTDAPVGSTTTIPAEIVLAARKKVEDEANKKLQELGPLVQPLEEFLKATKEFIPKDNEGVKLRIASFDDRIQKLVSLLQSTGAQFSTLTLQTQDVLRLAQERREEAYRLANQLELLRNDQFSADQQKKVLEDELVRLEENSRRLRSRQNQLKQQLGIY